MLKQVTGPEALELAWSAPSDLGRGFTEDLILTVFGDAEVFVC